MEKMSSKYNVEQDNWEICLEYLEICLLEYLVVIGKAQFSRKVY